MKIIRMSSELTRNIIPTAASRISAKYSPTCGVKSVSTEMRMVKIVSTRSATLTNWVKGVYHQHAFEEGRVLRQGEHPADGGGAADAGNHRADEEPDTQFQTAQRQEISRQHGQHGEDQDGFRRGELEQLKIADPAHGAPPFGSQSKSGKPKLGEIRSNSNRG